MKNQRNIERLAHVILVVGILSLLGALILVFTREEVSNVGSNGILPAPSMPRPLVKGNTNALPE